VALILQETPQEQLELGHIIIKLLLIVHNPLSCRQVMTIVKQVHQQLLINLLNGLSMSLEDLDKD
jgi:hypothetical protein